VLGKARMPDPESAPGSKTTHGAENVAAAPHGARQSPIGMAHPVPDVLSREKDGVVSGAASPALDGVCATSTPIRPGAVGVRL
jgi:hypothetical protein